MSEIAVECLTLLINSCIHNENVPSFWKMSIVTKKVLTIFFEIQSAFDKIRHNGLLYKLAKIRLPHLIKCIYSFLKDRKFYVKVNGAISSIRIIKCGVTQAVVLSPTLFSIYINELPIRLINDSRMIIRKFSELFADDIAYVVIFKSEHRREVEHSTQKYFDELERWMNK